MERMKKQLTQKKKKLNVQYNNTIQKIINYNDVTKENSIS